MTHEIGERPDVGAIPRFTLSGVPDAEITTHPFRTADGLDLALLRFSRDTGGDAVLVVHGNTTSTDMFVMPEHRNLVTCLLDEGYDVWCLDFRMSNRYPYNAIPNRYTMDDAALYDYPPALELIRAHVGDRRIHAIAHCIGSLTLCMSLAAGRIGGLTSVVANSVALAPRVPWWSTVKLAAGPIVFPLAGVEVMDPTWTDRTASLPGRTVAEIVKLVHRECDVPACHLLSLMWGAGWPALYEHANLDERTHRRAADLFGPAAIHFYRHMFQMVTAGAAVKYRPHHPAHASLPDDYLAAAAAIDTPILFTTGAHNRVFTDSNVVCHERLRSAGVTRHELAVFDGYGHQDVFMGRTAADDVFGQMIDFVARPR